MDIGVSRAQSPSLEPHWSVLALAPLESDSVAVRQCLASSLRLDLNAPREQGNTLLHLASFNNHHHAVRELLKHAPARVDVNMRFEELTTMAGGFAAEDQVNRSGKFLDAQPILLLAGICSRA